MKTRKNLFIALEGIDGSGKSTQTKLLTDKLTAQGHKVYSTFEPTNNQIGKLIRDILRGNTKADHRVIAGLFVADRLDHLLNEEYGIVKKLEEGYTVIMDRYLFSSYAYQGAHMDIDWVIEANAMSAQILRPDINIFIDVSPEVSMHRVHTNRESVELFETLDGLKLVRSKYMEAFEKQKDVENIFRVDGDQPVGYIADEIAKKVLTMLRENR